MWKLPSTPGKISAQAITKMHWCWLEGHGYDRMRFHLDKQNENRSGTAMVHLPDPLRSMVALLEDSLEMAKRLYEHQRKGFLNMFLIMFPN